MLSVLFQGTQTKYAHDSYDNVSHRSVIMAKELWPEYHDDVFEKTTDEMNVSANLEDYPVLEPYPFRETRV